MRSVRKELTNTYTRVLLQSLRNPDKLGQVTIGLVREHLKRGYDGSKPGARLHPAYGCILLTTNMMRALSDIDCGLVGIEIETNTTQHRTGGLLRLYAENSERPQHLSGGPLQTMWDNYCYDLTDVTLPGTGAVAASLDELTSLKSRGLQLRNRNGVTAALRRIAHWLQMQNKIITALHNTHFQPRGPWYTLSP
jgi:hypothetical protein